MSKSTYISIFSALCFLVISCVPMPQSIILAQDIAIKPAANHITNYLPLMANRRVGLVVNHTSMVNETHLVDTLLALGVKVVIIFAPEHGFGGKADAGEHINNDKYLDRIPIKSLYGKNKKPSAEDMSLIDVIVFDIQDVGVRFYTYLSTLHYVMEATAEADKEIIVLDRPNPNVFRIDGPVLEKANTSFVGLHPVPILYGMTIGEYAQMINGERWLANGVVSKLTVIPIPNFTRLSRYDLPVAPSPNLPNLRSILLYPSLCLFEGTDISVGRGTDKQFQLYGSPAMLDNGFSFTPVSSEGAKYPPHENVKCYGKDLSQLSVESLYQNPAIDLSYLLDAFAQVTLSKKDFFLSSNFFEKLAGTDELRRQLINNVSEVEIKASWAAGLEAFEGIRRKYLIYPDKI